MFPELIKLQNYSMGLAACYNQTFNEYNMPVHSHDYYEIMYISSGRCEIKVENKYGGLNSVILRKNDFIFIDTNKKHKLFIEPNSLCEVFNIEINLKNIDGNGNGVFDFSKVIKVCNKISPMLIRRNFITGHDTNSIKSTILKIQNSYAAFIKSSNDANDILVQLLLGQLLIEINHCCDTNNQQDNIYVQKTYEYIKNHYQDNITVDALSDYLNIHPTYLHKIFKQHVDDSVHNKINKFRVQKSIDLLGNTEFSLIDIAVEVGFNNRQSYFNAFKKCMGISPTEYRKTYLNNKKWLLDQSYKTSVFDEFQ